MMVKYTKHAKKNVVIRLIPPVAGVLLLAFIFLLTTYMAKQTKEVRDEVSAKYEAYKKAGNPPLMDDENPQNEIVFPKD